MFSPMASHLLQARLLFRVKLDFLSSISPSRPLTSTHSWLCLAIQYYPFLVFRRARKDAEATVAGISLLAISLFIEELCLWQQASTSFDCQPLDPKRLPNVMELRRTAFEAEMSEGSHWNSPEKANPEGVNHGESHWRGQREAEQGTVASRRLRCASSRAPARRWSNDQR